jgi:hypothetical protein
LLTIAAKLGFDNKPEIRFDHYDIESGGRRISLETINFVTWLAVSPELGPLCNVLPLKICGQFEGYFESHSCREAILSAVERLLNRSGSCGFMRSDTLPLTCSRRMQLSLF